MRRSGVAAVAAVAAALLVATGTVAAATDPSQLLRDRHDALQRAEVLARHNPDLAEDLTGLVDDVYAGRLAAAARDRDQADQAGQAGEVFDVATEGPSDDDIDRALAAAAAADGHANDATGTSNDNDSGATSNYHGLPAPGAALPDIPNVAPQLTGGQACPIAGPHRFINDWGLPRSGGRTHQGNDLFADTGTPVVSVEPGTVTRINPVDRWTPSARAGLGGITITVTSPAGTAWYYAHLDQLAAGLQTGMDVTAGQQIGTVGTTGNARHTPPHLHLGRYVNGTATNPYPSISELCR